MSKPDERQMMPLSQLTFYLAEGCSLACRRCSASAEISDAAASFRSVNLHAIKTGSLNLNGSNGKNGNGNANNGHAHSLKDVMRETYLPLETITQAVHEALPLGLRLVQLSGGAGEIRDPLLHPDFDMLIDHLESLELDVVIETSGAGLTPARAERLGRLPQCSVEIGLDGADAATHDAITGQPGSFATATDAITMLAQYDLAPRVIFNVMRSNAAQIPAVVRLVESLGAEALHLVVDWPGRLNGNANNGRSNRGSEGLSVEQLIAIGRKVERELSRGTRLQLIFDQPPAFRGLHSSARVDGHGRCGILNNLAVLPNGGYALCGIAAGFATSSGVVGSGAAAPSMIFGKVGETPLESIWLNHPTLRLLRGGMPDRLEGVCERCIMKTACLGNCPAENYQRTGSLWGPYWFCEAAERAGLFPASRLIENRW